MVATPTRQEERRAVGPISLQVFSGGQGERLVILHDYEYLNKWEPYEETLAQQYAVLAPSHPGYGSSDLPRDFDTIDDFAYFYLDLLRDLGPEPVNLVGLGVGGWIAAEVAVRCTHQIKRLVLVDAVGIKVGDRTTRDIADTFVIGAKEFLDLAWHDPEAGARQMQLAGLGNYTEEELVTILRGRQTTALFAWKPFLHNPKLRAWLRRIDVPALVLWGESDKIVTPDYGRAFADAIPGARFQLIPAAGHYPYLEQPEAFTAAVTAFLHEGETASAPRANER
ncbi:MAG TPA: alpha/beta hydrolase [Chloroflexota bacterium]|nr:alpha/beta hydrolase [Chloroflexota bacterium]